MDYTYDSGGAQRLAAWDDELEELYSRLSGRGSFRYDAASDALYTAARDRAVVNGRLAMRDSMGQAAALTGGYGSSFAQAVGQREYDDYLRSLGEAMPQFYAMAQQHWQQEGDDLRDRYDLLYRRASDERERQAAAQAAAARAEREAYERQAAADKAAAQQRQTNYSALVKLIQSSGYRPSDAELSAAGLSRAAADALAEAYLRSLQPARRSGGGSSSSQTKKAEAAEKEKETQSAPAARQSSTRGGSGKLVQMTR